MKKFKYVWVACLFVGLSSFGNYAAADQAEMLCQNYSKLIPNIIRLRSMGVPKTTAFSQVQSASRVNSDLGTFMAQSVNLAYAKPNYFNDYFNSGQWLTDCGDRVRGYSVKSQNSPQGKARIKIIYDADTRGRLNDAAECIGAFAAAENEKYEAENDPATIESYQDAQATFQRYVDLVIKNVSDQDKNEIQEKQKRYKEKSYTKMQKYIHGDDPKANAGSVLYGCGNFFSSSQIERILKEYDIW
ncbi:MAG: hypothetical protein HWE34_15095 [Methylocystaceae bacterium]|nr:hypothetical protein [Methylocystaceae bacterium]